MRVMQSIPLMMTTTTLTSCCPIVHLMQIEFRTLQINRWSIPRPIRNYQMENRLRLGVKWAWQLEAVR